MPGTLFGLLACATFLSGCGNPSEDVRLSFCRTLVLTQLPATTPAVWTGVTIDARGYDGLSIRLRFETPSAGEAVCGYPWRSVEDTALTLADPLAAYGTSPTSLEMNGRLLSRPALAKAIKDAVVLQARGLAGQIRAALPASAGH
ncbi:hypothetical protein [Thiocystis violascens]|nr:hypothetical protein [Thiocystis violascens]